MNKNRSELIESIYDLSGISIPTLEKLDFTTLLYLERDLKAALDKANYKILKRTKLSFE